MLLDVESVLPEHWVRSSAWSLTAKGPGAYTRIGRDSQPKDFAGIPFEELRAYQWDNGFEAPLDRVASSSPNDTPTPLRVREVQLTRSGLTVHVDSVAGIKYQLLESLSPEGPYRVVDEITPSQDGDQTLQAALSAVRGFYRVLVTQP